MADDAERPAEDALWNGVGFSGITVVLGVGTGKLIRLLLEQAIAAEGSLVVAALNLRPLEAVRKALGPLATHPSLAVVQARPRQIPVLRESVDLLVVNGVLREVPENRLQAISEEFWRVLVPGGKLRISDVIEPSEAPYDVAWTQRNRIVRKLARALEKPTALAVNLQRAALALRAAGFDEMALSILPGYALTDAWLEETVNNIRAMAGRLVDRALRDELLNRDVNQLIAAYAQGQQRAAERFVLRGVKAGDLTLDMGATFPESDRSGQRLPPVQ